MKKLPRLLRKLIKAFLYSLLVFVLAVSLLVVFSGDSEYKGSLDENVVNDSTQLNPIHVAKVITPHSTADIVMAIKKVEMAYLL